MENKTVEIDLTKTYTYKEMPDTMSGRCDNCGKAHFMSKVGGGKFLRECVNCGMKKLI